MALSSYMKYGVLLGLTPFLVGGSVMADERNKAYERLLEVDKSIANSIPATVQWSDDGKSLWFMKPGVTPPQFVQMDIPAGRIEFLNTPPQTPQKAATTDRPRVVGSSWPRGDFIGSVLYEVMAPDGRHFVGKKDDNLYIRAAGQADTAPLTKNGQQFFDWELEGVKWNKAGNLIATFRIDNRHVEKTDRIAWVDGKSKVTQYAKPLVGTALPYYTLCLLAVSGDCAVQSDLPKNTYYRITGFTPDDKAVLITGLARDGKTIFLLSLDIKTGQLKTVLEEKTDTFFVPGTNSFQPVFVNDQEFLWVSPRDGVENIYLHNLSGKDVRKVTDVSLPISYIATHLDGQVYYVAPDNEQRPYDQHLWRIALAGGEAKRLTTGDGQHVIQFSPKADYFVDFYSSVTHAPVAKLVRNDGTYIADIAASAITPTEFWHGHPPEEFTVLAADQKTTLHGVLYKPYDFDPSKKYPIIQFVYGGPHVTITQRHFGPGQISSRGMIISGYFNTAPALAQLGFITFTVDGRGTPGRGKAFQDVAYQDIGDHAVADYTTALDQIAADRPYMDLSRVGVYGRSLGGYVTLRAMLMANDRYHVGVASAPAKLGHATSASYEFYLGDPVKDKTIYDHADNAKHVDKLNGDLLLLFPTLDYEVPFQEAMDLTDALVKANKAVDMMVMPNQNHMFMPESEPLYINYKDSYRNDLIKNYFIDKLQRTPASD